MRVARRWCFATMAGLALAASVPPRPVHAAKVEERALGDPSAKITVIEWFSLTCPHCAAFHLRSLPEIKRRFIDTGQLRLIVRDFPTDGVSLKAHVLAHCAGGERYFQFVDALLGSQDRWANAKDPIGALKQIAKLGGLSDAQIEACLADRAMEDDILRSRLEAQQKYDVRSTPSFLINGRVHAGNRSAEEFAKLIEPLLR